MANAPVTPATFVVRPVMSVTGPSYSRREMGRSDLKDTSFVCAICGARFEALAGPTPPPVTYCGDCGLKYSSEQLDAIRRAKANRGDRKL